MRHADRFQRRDQEINDVGARWHYAIVLSRVRRARIPLDPELFDCIATLFVPSRTLNAKINYALGTAIGCDKDGVVDTVLDIINRFI